MVRSLDLAGKAFGKLIVLCRMSNDKHGKSRWMCQCECGYSKTINGSSLVTGNTTSCGCFNKEVVSGLMSTHGESASKEYVAWVGMKERCNNPKNPSYGRYGGRGITVCDEWKVSFEKFKSDMGPRPEGTSIDRIDNNLGYFKENCRWATKKQQSRNQSSNHKVETGGTVFNTIAEAAEFLGIPKSTGRYRVGMKRPIHERRLNNGHLHRDHD